MIANKEMNMKTIIGTLLLGLIFCTSCLPPKKELVYHTSLLFHANPKNYVYHSPIEKVDSTLNAMLQDMEPRFQKSSPADLKKYYAQDDDYVIVSGCIQQRSFLHSYIGSSDQVMVSMILKIQLDPITPTSTMVTVHLINYQLYVNDKKKNTYQKIDIVSNTIEEYALLYYLGMRLKESNMPPIYLPADIIPEVGRELFLERGYKDISPKDWKLE